MKDKSEAMFDELCKLLKESDEKLYYKFVNFVSEYLSECRITQKEWQHYSSDLKNQILQWKLLAEKTQTKFHDFSIKTEHDYENLRKSTTLQYEQAVQNVLEESRKEFEMLDNIAKLLYNAPRLSGLCLLVFGKRHLDFVKSINQKGGKQS